jgi:transposase
LGQARQKRSDDVGMASNDRDVSTGDRVLGLRGFRIVGDESTPDELILTIETTEQRPPRCPRCGTQARALGRYPVHYRDLPAFGMPVRLIWKCRRWHCPNPVCSTKTWSEESDQMASGTTLTKRAAMEITRLVGQVHSVQEVADEFGVSWEVAMKAVIEFGEPLVEDEDRVGEVDELGVDETSFLKAKPDQRTQFATGLVDLGARKMIDFIEGNSADDLGAWIDRQPTEWLERIKVVATDLTNSYRAGLSPALDHAIRVADPFHVTRLGARTVDDVRRRVQREELGHRGRRQDPLYKIRRLLLRGSERLDDRGWERVLAGIEVGDPKLEVTMAWLTKDALREVYGTGDVERASLLLDNVIAACEEEQIPEMRRLGRTLQSWRTEILAHHTTGASNGPTEGLNLIVKQVKRVAFGFRKFSNYRLRVLLRTGGVHWWRRPTPALVFHPATGF